MVKQAIRAWVRTKAAAQVSRRVAPVYSLTLWRMVWRAHRLYRAKRFDPVEAFRLGLLHPQCPAKAALGFVSRWELTKAQLALNPEAFAPMLKDKGDFYMRCAAHGLPIPKLYALLVPGGVGWCAQGPAPAAPGEWARYIEATVPREFAIKPITGTLSEGFDILTRCAGGFRDTKGRVYAPERLVERLWQTVGGSRGWVLQERLRNHLDLARLSGTDYLQTLRLVTLIDRQGGCHIACSELRVIPGEEIADNSMVDLTGSLELPVDLERGLTRAGVQLHGDGLGPRFYERHPKTGLPLAGFAVPCWHEACALVKKAAPAFLPLRTIGWDVAITPTGLYLVEGNIWWNNGKKHADFRRVFERLRQAT